MLAYVMVGSSNLKRSAKFYDAALAPLGLVQTGGTDRYIGYGPKSAPKKSQFYVTKPYNEACNLRQRHDDLLVAKSRKAVDGFHAAALASGGTDDGAGTAPGRRHQLRRLRPRSRRQQDLRLLRKPK
jgi:hypothetical protein